MNVPLASVLVHSSRIVIVTMRTRCQALIERSELKWKDAHSRRVSGNRSNFIQNIIHLLTKLFQIYLILFHRHFFFVIVVSFACLSSVSFYFMNI